MVIIIIGFILSVIVGAFFIDQTYNILISCKMLQPNFKNEMIPIGMGIFFIPSLILLSIFINISYSSNIPNLILVGTIVMAFVGYLDDSNLDKTNKGFKGHLKQLKNLKITTGMLKAIAGLGISLYIALNISASIGETLLNTLVIALFTNYMNLWDLRPGRVSKMFLFIAILILSFSVLIFKIYLLLMITLMVIYIIGDLKAKYMLGDTGSNLLGIFLGIVVAFNLDINAKILCLFLLVIFHILAEKISFSKIIENHKILKYIDMMGRKI